MAEPPPPFDAAYAELRRLAAARLASEPAGHTLQPTALVHEAYLRLAAIPGRWQTRGHFFTAAAEAMRRVLIDHARSRRALKRGGPRKRIPLGDAAEVLACPDSLIDLDDALSRLAADEPNKAELVKLRFFVGLTMPEAAEALDVSLATAERWWNFARAWLLADLADNSSEA